MVRNKKIIVSTVGFGRAGKDTTVEIINKLTGAKRKAYADKLKNLAKNLNYFLPIRGLSEEERLLLFQLLTKCVNKFDLVESESGEFLKIPYWDGTDENKRLPCVDLGAGARNYVNSEIWVDALWSDEKTRDDAKKYGIAVSDCRYRNESEKAKQFAEANELDYKLIYIERPNTTAQGEELEKTLPLKDVADVVIQNDGTIEELEEKIKAVLDLA